MEDDKYFSFAELDLAAATTSTGYLEDALFSKRRRLLINPHHQQPHDQSQSHCYGYGWEKSSQNFHVISPEVELLGEIFSASSAASTEPDAEYYSSSSSGRAKSVSSAVDDGDQYHSCNSGPTATHQLLHHQHFAWVGRGIEIKEEENADEDRKQQKIVTLPSTGGGGGRRRRRRVAYPFALVKPGGGEEGVVTIEEINSRLLMTPTRPLRHPVGDFACRPCVTAAGRPGLSGKAVVALTKIYTQGGKGTVTIIRTKG
ncbi:unnamed protein product [Linum trigynum]|uniref:Protein XRI1 n=1 Tax=Linum trigynum TaxID=586398 RepID=A0AAV2FDD6_9ROSI